MQRLLRSEQVISKLLLPTAAALGAVVHPERADLVGITSEITGLWKYKRLASQLQNREGAQGVLTRCPQLSQDSLVRARACSPGTLGHAYATFMDNRHFQPTDRPPVSFIYDNHSWIAATRVREIHDILHVLFACPTTLRGELALKAIEYVQYGIPAHWASVYFASSRLPVAERNFFMHHLLPWALRAGSKATNLLEIHYEAHFDSPLIELRSKWNVEQLTLDALDEPSGA